MIIMSNMTRQAGNWSNSGQRVEVEVKVLRLSTLELQAQLYTELIFIAER